jgi:aminotransferase EvaB
MAQQQPLVPFNDLSRQTRSLGGKLSSTANDVITSGNYLQGLRNAQFETAYAHYIGVPFVVTVANGTDALEIALRALGCRSGDEIITVANAGMYATHACLAIGATPVYADIHAETMLMSIDSVTRALSERTKAVVATHLYGAMVDIGALRAALPEGIFVVEDCAQAHGAALRNEKAGSLGDVGAFSFYPTKNLGALGDGGAVSTGDGDICERVRKLSQYGWDQRFHSVLPGGRNSRMDEIQAAVLHAKLDYLSDWNHRRVSIERRLRAAAAGTRFVFPDRDFASYVAHLCVVRHPRRDWVRRQLEQRGIGTAIHYPVLDHKQASMQAVAFRSTDLSTTESVHPEILSLPCFPELTSEEVDRVCEALRVVE